MDGDSWLGHHNTGKETDQSAGGIWTRTNQETEIEIRLERTEMGNFGVVGNQGLEVINHEGSV